MQTNGRQPAPRAVLANSRTLAMVVVGGAKMAGAAVVRLRRRAYFWPRRPANPLAFACFMIVYKSTDWWEALRHLRASGVIRLLLKRVLLVGLYATAATVGSMAFEQLNIAVDKEFFTFLGILLSLLLAFRTNTAYDRFYEGRRLWGQLVNTSS